VDCSDHHPVLLLRVRQREQQLGRQWLLGMGEQWLRLRMWLQQQLRVRMRL